MAKKAAKAAPAKKSAPKKVVAKAPAAKVPAKKVAVAKVDVKSAKVKAKVVPSKKEVKTAAQATKKVEAPKKKGALANAVAKIEALKNKVTAAKNENVKKLEAMVPAILKSDKKSKKKEEAVVEVEETVVSNDKPMKLSKLERSKMTEDEAKWWDLHEKNKTQKAPNYDMREAFEANKPIQHKLLGWGFVLNNDNDRLEVLFKDGKRMLISNRK